VKLARLCAASVVAAAFACMGAATTAMASPVRVSGSQQVSRPAGFRLPYTDPDQAGWLTLCNVALKPITHGLITAKPFIWRVVSNVPATKGFFVKGAKAVLFAYQPRPYTPAGAWSGTQMSSSSLYTNPNYPMVQSTPLDLPLTQMTVAFPPIWDHLIELRVYLGAPGIPEDTIGYGAADLQVIGDTWTLVAGGHSSCTDGSAVSEERAVHMPGSSGTPTEAAGGGGGGGGTAKAPVGPVPTPSTGSGPGSSSTSTPSSSGSGPGGTSAASPVSDDSSGTPIVWVGAGFGVIVALLVAGGVWRRRGRSGI
jgi:hypothetical protein